MRFHLPGLPHTVTNKSFIHCAFTQKVYKLCKMLNSLGHEVYHYGCEGSDPECTEHIQVITDEFRRKYYPDEWHEKQWDYNIQDDCHKEFYKKTIKEIKKRAQSDDFLLCSWGWGHWKIADELGKSMLVVEPGIGYKDTFASFRVFESYTWMAYVYGRGQVDTNSGGQRVPQENGRFFDAVIPNYFDPADFDFTPDEKEDYFLFLGRLVSRKGYDVAVETMQRIGGHLKIAGIGKFELPVKKGNEIIEFVGFADVEKRRRLLSRAKAVIMPTIYHEPFGGVAVEAMMSGTPVITTDWGVFPETVLHGLTGYRCRALEHFEWACRNIDNLSPQVCRDWAMSNFTLKRVAKMYQEYFEMLRYVKTKDGWYRKNRGRAEMTWLEKHYPNVPPCSISKPFEINKKKLKKLDAIIQPEEKEPDYALDLSWYGKEKKPGISFILRAKNEQETISMALDTLAQLKTPYEINLVLNQCEDKTEEIVKQHIKNGQNINLFYYPFQLGKTGLENVCTPVTSVHSTIWLLNWMLMKGNYEFTFRWDADFVMTPSLARNVEKAVDTPKADIYNIGALFSDSGISNREPYLWSNHLIPRYCRYCLWHLTKFGRTDPRISSIKASIIHDSPLSQLKSYWNAPPWWETENRDETSEMRTKIKEQYANLLEGIGKDCTTQGRASCPDSEELARRVQGILGGADIDEIPALKKHTSNI